MNFLYLVNRLQEFSKTYQVNLDNFYSIGFVENQIRLRGEFDPEFVQRLQSTDFKFSVEKTGYVETGIVIDGFLINITLT